MTAIITLCLWLVVFCCCSALARGQTDLCSVSQFVNQVSGYSDDVCTFLGILPKLIKPIQAACDISPIVNDLSDVVDNGCQTQFTENAIVYTPTTMITGICVTGVYPIQQSDPNCNPEVMDYNCASKSYMSQVNCTSFVDCALPYTNKFFQQCKKSKGLPPTYVKEWSNLPSSCSFVPMQQIGASTVCSSNYITVQDYMCARPAKPLSIVQFLHDDRESPVDFVQREILQYLGISTAWEYNVQEVDLQTFNDPNSPFVVDGGHFIHYFDDAYYHNTNVNSNGACKLVTMTYLKQSNAYNSVACLIPAAFATLIVSVLALVV